MRAKTIEILKSAMDGGYAVGAFNTSNLEFTQSIVRAAHDLSKPCVVQMTTNAMKYAGSKVLGEVVNSVVEHESNSTPIGPPPNITRLFICSKNIDNPIFSIYVWLRHLCKCRTF